MSFTSKCPHCNAEFEADQEWIGMQAQCPVCGKEIVIKNLGLQPEEKYLPESSEVKQNHSNNVFSQEKDAADCICDTCNADVKGSEKIIVNNAIIQTATGEKRRVF